MVVNSCRWFKSSASDQPKAASTEVLGWGREIKVRKWQTRAWGWDPGEEERSLIDVKKLFLESWGKCTYDFQPSDKIKIFTIETKSLNYVQGTHGYFGKLLLGSFFFPSCFQD